MVTCVRSFRAASRRSHRLKKRTARAESTSASTGPSTKRRASPWADRWEITCSTTCSCRCIAIKREMIDVLRSFVPKQIQLRRPAELLQFLAFGALARWLAHVAFGREFGFFEVAQ